MGEPQLEYLVERSNLRGLHSPGPVPDPAARPDLGLVVLELPCAAIATRRAAHEFVASWRGRVHRARPPWAPSLVEHVLALVVYPGTNAAACETVAGWLEEAAVRVCRETDALVVWVVAPTAANFFSSVSLRGGLQRGMPFAHDDHDDFSDETNVRLLVRLARHYLRTPGYDDYGRSANVYVALRTTAATECWDAALRLCSLFLLVGVELDALDVAGGAGGVVHLHVLRDMLRGPRAWLFFLVTALVAHDRWLAALLPLRNAWPAVAALLNGVPLPPPPPRSPTTPRPVPRVVVVEGVSLPDESLHDLARTLERVVMGRGDTYPVDPVSWAHSVQPTLRSSRQPPSLREFEQCVETALRRLLQALA